MKVVRIFAALVLCGASSSFGMWKRVIKKRNTRYSKEKPAVIKFESKAVIESSKKEDIHVLLLYYVHNKNHPMIAGGKRPYKKGNGGLLNPELKKYSVEVEEKEKGVEILLKGELEAEGFAPVYFSSYYTGRKTYFFEELKPVFSFKSPQLREYEKQDFEGGCYTMSYLEYAILEAVKNKNFEFDNIRTDVTELLKEQELTRLKALSNNKKTAFIVKEIMLEVSKKRSKNTYYKGVEGLIVYKE